MILAINAGNSRVTFGCIGEKNEIGRVFTLPTDLSETALGYAIRFRSVFDLFSLDPASFEGAILSSVVPPLRNVLKEAVSYLTKKEPLVVSAGVKTGLRIKVDDPGTVGTDLVCAAVAAKEEYPLPCIVVNLGTATTLTCVDREGSYVGGAILPGVSLSLDALVHGTSLLPKIDRIPPKKAISTSTVECMRSGILYGAAGAVDGLLDRFFSELGEKEISLICTGSLAREIAPHCRHRLVCDENLILKGLGMIYRKNQVK